MKSGRRHDEYVAQSFTPAWVEVTCRKNRLFKGSSRAGIVLHGLLALSVILEQKESKRCDEVEVDTFFQHTYPVKVSLKNSINVKLLHALH